MRACVGASNACDGRMGGAGYGPSLRQASRAAHTGFCWPQSSATTSNDMHANRDGRLLRRPRTGRQRRAEPSQKRWCNRADDEGTRLGQLPLQLGRHRDYGRLMTGKQADAMSWPLSQTDVVVMVTTPAVSALVSRTNCWSTSVVSGKKGELFGGLGWGRTDRRSV